MNAERNTSFAERIYINVLINQYLSFLRRHHGLERKKVFAE